MKKTLKDYDYYVVKTQLDGEDAERLEKITDKPKGVLLRELILNFLSLVGEKKYQDEDPSLYDDEFSWEDLGGDIVTQKTLRKREYISKEDRQCR